MGAYIWEGGMLGGMVVRTTRSDSTQNIEYGQRFHDASYLMMRWIPKDAGYIYKVSRSGLEDNVSHICLKNAETWLGCLKNHTMCIYIRPCKVDRRHKIGLGRSAMPLHIQRSHYFQIRGHVFSILLYVICFYDFQRFYDSIGGAV